MNDPQLKLLRVTTSHFVAGAVFEKKPLGMWKCVKAAPILGWMKGHDDHVGVAKFLKGPGKKNGWRYEWL